MLTIRKAAPPDAERIVSLLSDIVLERVYTAITEPWPVRQQERYIASLSDREAIHLAEDADGNLAGYQVLELWAPTIASMAHVGQVGTFVRSDWRGRGVGRILSRHTRDFATARGYAKFVIQVRAGNAGAQTFYQRQGFRECGRLTRQVRVEGVEEDEILMELCL